MRFRNAKRWYFASAQASTAAGMMYWAERDYQRAVDALHAISLWDYWSLPSAVLIVLHLPAMLVGGAVAFVLHLPDFVGKVIVILFVFLLWVWIGPFLTEGLRPGNMPLWGSIVTVLVATLGAFLGFTLSPPTIALFVKVTAAIFWSSVALVTCRAKLLPDKTSEPR